MTNFALYKHLYNAQKVITQNIDRVAYQTIKA